jgi:hypothetical protein
LVFLEQIGRRQKNTILNGLKTGTVISGSLNEGLPSGFINK